MASRATTGRAIAVVVGLGLAAVAAVLLWRYVEAADQRALEDAELVEVWVASGGGIPAGTSASAAFSTGLIERAEWLRANRPESAVTNLDQITGLVAIDPIQDGAVLQTGQWGEPGLSDVDFEIDPGRVAMSLQVAVPEGLSGYLSQGDRVGIIAHIAASAPVIPGTDEPAAPPESDETRAQYVTDDAEVLAIGRRVVTTDPAGAVAEEVQQTEQVLATLSVTPADAEKLVFANYEGLLYVTLLPEEGTLANTPGSTFDDLFTR